jgi:hypothetical protein
MPFHPIHEALQTSQKQGPVGKAGEHIVGSVKKQFFLTLFPFCYIAGIVDDAADILVLSQVSNHTLEVEPTSVCMSQPELNDRILYVRDRSRTRAHGLQEIVRMNVSVRGITRLTG